MLNNNDIMIAQQNLNSIINGTNHSIDALQNFINRVAANFDNPYPNVVNQTNNLIVQINNLVDAHPVISHLIVELEYRIGISGPQVSGAWVKDIVQRLIEARMNNNYMFVNNFINTAEGYNINEKLYVINALRSLTNYNII